MTADQDLQGTDSKARRKLEDQQRMAYRRAIEERAELRRLQAEFGDLPDLLASNYLHLALAPWQRERR